MSHRALSDDAIQLYAAIYAGKACQRYPGSPHYEHRHPFEVGPLHRAPCPAYQTAHKVLTELRDHFGREVPHENKEPGKGPISDARLDEMCEETRWWKHDDDEIHRVVHELRNLRRASRGNEEV